MPSPCRLGDALPNLQRSCQRALLDPADRIIVALDGMVPADALALARALPELRWVKVGLELFVAGGPAVVQQLLVLPLCVQSELVHLYVMCE